MHRRIDPPSNEATRRLVMAISAYVEVDGERPELTGEQILDRTRAYTHTAVAIQKGYEFDDGGEG